MSREQKDTEYGTRCGGELASKDRQTNDRPTLLHNHHDKDERKEDKEEAGGGGGGGRGGMKRRRGMNEK